MSDKPVTAYRAKCGEFLASYQKELVAPVVDVGGKATRAWMEGILKCRFETWDKRSGKCVSRVVDIERAREIPAASIGTVIVTSVLEHVRRPWRAAEHIGRMVKIGGLLLVTCPWQYPFHAAPDDYWRGTAQALAVLFGRWFIPLQMDMFDCTDGTMGSLYAGRRAPE